MDDDMRQAAEALLDRMEADQRRDLLAPERELRKAMRDTWVEIERTSVRREVDSTQLALALDVMKAALRAMGTAVAVPLPPGALDAGPHRSMCAPWDPDR
jgi:hypothetical protein